MNDIRPLPREEVRCVDQLAIEELGMTGLVLMENAGRNAARLLLDQGISGQVVICAGKGNNGGDGFVIARHLENAGVSVEVLLFAPPAELTGDARGNYEILHRAGITVLDCSSNSDIWQPRLHSAQWIVDSLLGTGTRGTIREPYASVIPRINSSRASVFAVDLPSGMDCDTGQPLGPCIRADLTATFVARKTGFVQPAARCFTGAIHVLEIGVPLRWLRRLFESE